MPPVDIVAGPVAGPASAARTFRPYLIIVPASSVHKAMGHITFHPAPVCLDRKFIHAVFPAGVN